LIICIRGLAQNIHHNSVYDAYLEAGRHWIAGSDDLYGPLALQFRYSPLVAAFFALFTFLPERLGSLLWRLLNAGALLAAFSWWLRRVLPDTWNAKERAIFLLLTLPLSAGSLNNAQANPLMTALMLLALAAVHVQRWNLASAFLVVACFLKLYPLALGMILALLYPRQLIWRQLLGIAAGAAICFLAQSPAYVAREFGQWFHFLQGDLRFDWPLEAGYRDLHLVLSLLHVPVSQPVYTALQLLGALAVAVLCYAARKASGPVLMKLVYSLVCCWILLLGPATESSTYILLAPALAWQLIDAWHTPHSRVYRGTLLFASLLIVIALVAVWFPFAKTIHAMGPHPLAALVFVGCVLYEAK
jgi:hypothetical protein